MSAAAAQLLTWLNAAFDPVGRWLLAPVAWLPGWLSLTLVSVVTGVLLLLAFKYTSNQRAIRRARDGISANLLALKLFKDEIGVSLRTQGRLLIGAGRLLLHAVLPTAVMALPVTLLLGQLSLWYQRTPLKVDDEAVVTVKLRTDRDGPQRAEAANTVALLASPGGQGPLLAAASLCPDRPTPPVFPEVSLLAEGAEVTGGPVRIFDTGEVCWNVTARKDGYHHLRFEVDGQTFDKELAVGDGFRRVSASRPERDLSEDLFFHPGEQPFGPESPVRSVDIDYPDRTASSYGYESWGWYRWMKARLDSWSVTRETKSALASALSSVPGWMLYWFVVSLIAAFCLRRLFKVHV